MDGLPGGAGRSRDRRLDGAGSPRPAEAASWAGQALAAEPLRESSVLLLVRALAATGDQAGALAAFDEYRGRLAAEAGLDPTPQARQIRQRMAADPPAGEPDPSPYGTAGQAASSPPGGGIRSSAATRNAR